MWIIGRPAVEDMDIKMDPEQSPSRQGPTTTTSTGDGARATSISSANSYSSARTGAVVISTVFCEWSILGVLALLHRSGSVAHEDFVLQVVYYVLCLCLGLVLLDAADKRSIEKARAAFAGFWLLAVVDMVWTVIDLVVWHGHPDLNPYFDPVWKFTMLITYAWVLIAIRQLIEDINAIPQCKVQTRCHSCGWSLQTGAICVGTTFMVTSIPLAIWLVFYLPGDTLATFGHVAPVPWIVKLAVFAAVTVTYILVGYKLLRRAREQAAPVTWTTWTFVQTVPGFVFVVFLVLFTLVIVAGILLDTSWVQILVDGAIMAFHAGALLIVSRLASVAANGNP